MESEINFCLHEDGEMLAWGKWSQWAKGKEMVDWKWILWDHWMAEWGMDEKYNIGPKEGKQIENQSLESWWLHELWQD